jgi:hypothetical protein
LPIVAWSAIAEAAGEAPEGRVLVGSLLAVEGAAGRAGSVPEDGVRLPAWFGFHIVSYFLSLTSNAVPKRPALRFRA